MSGNLMPTLCKKEKLFFLSNLILYILIILKKFVLFRNHKYDKNQRPKNSNNINYLFCMKPF